MKSKPTPTNTLKRVDEKENDFISGAASPMLPAKNYMSTFGNTTESDQP